MRILFIGQLGSGQTVQMRMECLREWGHNVVAINSQAPWQASSWLSRHLQKAAESGPVITWLNREVLRVAREFRPQLFWGEKQEYLRPETLAELREMGMLLLHYTPDPYFTLTWKRTSLMDRCMPLFDYAVTSKRYELEEYRKTCRKVIYVPLGYGESVHRPVTPRDRLEREAFASDVGFLGGWEPRREVLLDAIARTGCRLKIWGFAWDHLKDGRWTVRRAWRCHLLAGKDPYRIVKNDRLGVALQGDEVYGDRYAYALSGARISVGFLRHVCPDQHTTRSFEIPACASMMIADRTDEHQEFFTEGKEADFFSTPEELVDKVRYYLRNEQVREKIAWAGYRRCVDSGYAYQHRVREVLQVIKNDHVGLS